MIRRGREVPDPFRPARWVEFVGRARTTLSDRSAVRLDAADLRRRAAGRLGRLVDTDDPGLDVLVADAATTGLTDLGRLAVRAQLLRRIVTAEALTDTLLRWPQLDAVHLPRPLVIVGLPRTGTTLLHSLLACDRAAVAPRFWQLQRPAPPPSSAFDSGMRYARAALTVLAARAMLPTLGDIHPLATSQPEECNFLFRDIAMYAVAFPAFGYLRWLHGAGATAVDYSSYRRHLQVLLSAQSGRRPVLKSPFHLGHLDDLLGALPDAQVVHTHREPTAALASWCSFAATIGRGTTTSVDLSTLGQHWMDFWAYAAERAVSVRGRADARRFHDVRYAELVADPLREVRRLYVAADLELTPTVEQRMQGWLDRHRRRRRPQHRYNLNQFDLTPATVNARFRAYQSL
jgi:Sulfotransferase family